MLNLKPYFVITVLFFIKPNQGTCSNIKKEITTKYLIDENDTIVDFIETNFYSEKGSRLKNVLEVPLSKIKTVNFFSENKLWYSLVYKDDVREDSTIYCYNYKGFLAFSEAYTANNIVKKTTFNYAGQITRKDNYQLGNNSQYFLISYEITKIDSVANTYLIEFINIDDTYSSQINLLSFDLAGKLLSNKTLNNLDNTKIIWELKYEYNNDKVIKEILVDDEGNISLITFDYIALDVDGNWTKKTARITTKNGEQTEVGYEIRTIEYW